MLFQLVAHRVGIYDRLQMIGFVSLWEVINFLEISAFWDMHQNPSFMEKPRSNTFLGIINIGNRLAGNLTNGHLIFPAFEMLAEVERRLPKPMSIHNIFVSFLATPRPSQTIKKTQTAPMGLQCGGMGSIIYACFVISG